VFFKEGQTLLLLALKFLYWQRLDFYYNSNMVVTSICSPLALLLRREWEMLIGKTTLGKIWYLTYWKNLVAHSSKNPCWFRRQLKMVLPNSLGCINYVRRNKIKSMGLMNIIISIIFIYGFMKHFLNWENYEIKRNNT